MKTLLASLWKRRWCRFLGIGLIACALPLLHPFIRQAIFGPQIDGIPWCYWEDEIRRTVHAGEKPSWFITTMEKIGLFKRPEIGGIAAKTEAFFPLYLHLTDDGDPKVRRFALNNIEHWLPKHHAEILPILRRQLQDADPQCRLSAAGGIWDCAKDIEMKSIVLPLHDHNDPRIRMQAAYLLGEMAAVDADLFAPLSKLADDADSRVRNNVVRSMQHFGAVGVPILRKAMRDPDKFVRLSAIETTWGLGEHAAALVPDLVVLQNDPDPSIRRNASHRLYKMDPKQFPKPATWID